MQPRLEPYAFKCTAASGGSDYFGDLRGGARHHFIATTVELLTTGVDVPCVRNIVFFKYVRSPIAFYQMVGRGTRIDPPTGKLMFRVYDYTDATRLFGEEFRTKFIAPKKPPKGEPPPPPEATIIVEGFDVRITDAGRYIVTQVDGKAMPVTVEEYKERLTASLIEEVPTLDEFRKRWTVPAERRDLMGKLPDGGRSPLLIRELEDMQGYDLYDVLGELVTDAPTHSVRPRCGLQLQEYRMAFILTRTYGCHHKSTGRTICPWRHGRPGESPCFSDSGSN